MQRTLLELFQQSVQRYSDNPVTWDKKEGEYQPTTYRAAFKIVAEIAAGLLNLGIQKGDRVILLSEGCKDWIFSDFGILFAGGICVPLSVKLQDPLDIQFRFNHSGARFVIVSDRQADKILSFKKDLPDIDRIIVLGSTSKLDKELISIAGLRATGKKFLNRDRSFFEKRWQSVREEDPASICFTSGTIADPKGIVLTHRNYTANVEQARASFHVEEHYITLLILPWDHPFVHTCGIYTSISCGASIASAEQGKTSVETVRNIGKNIKEIKPHIILSIPALSDIFQRNIERGFVNAEKSVERLFKRGLRTAHLYQGSGFRKGRWHGNPILKPLYSFFNTLVFSKIRQQFGGRLNFFIGGGSLLNVRSQEFFSAIGLPIYQGYGLIEAAPVISTNSPDNLKMGTAGKIVPDLKIKICDEHGNELPPGETGEIVVQGENITKGYWRNPAATSKTIRDGWLFTGDMGYLDKENFLVVLGRYQNLLISDDGEKFSPEGIEECLAGQSPYIRQIMLYNNQKPYTTALIVTDKQAIENALQANNHSPQKREGQDYILTLLSNAIKGLHNDALYGERFPGKWIPATFALLGESFTESNRFLNSALKTVRWRITRHYQDRIDKMYTSEGEDPFNRQNRIIVQRMFDDESYEKTE